ncbi:MAG TPA: cytochrome ubiquinol oxidase subunit I, partial [Gemmatimonadales bacterium]|nr:cytochrome ubiquinol oxidase subunit I [Gemmatimonadales bacterium]
VTNVDPIAGMLNPMAFQQTLHMTLAAYTATGFGVAGIHAFLLLFDRGNAFHRRALGIALLVGVPAALLQPISGDLSAKAVARLQPAKLAAMEAHFETGTRAPLLIGGWPDPDTRETRYAIRIPGGLSFLAFGDFDAEVRGLEEFPREDWPHVPIVHTAFQVMVALGTFLALLSVWIAWTAWRRHDLAGNRWLLRAIAFSTPMGFIAIEAGWIVTEVGRQPWTIYGVLRTADAVTPMPGLLYPFLLFTLLYCFLGVIVAYLLYKQIVRSPRPLEWTRIYTPDAGGRGRA